MSEQYTISAVSPQTFDDGDYRVYYVKLAGANPAPEGLDHFELTQKPSSKAPEAGQKIDVKTFKEGVRDGRPYVKIIKDWDAIKARSNSNSSAGGGGNKSYERSPDHPLNMARAVHNGAASMVTQVIEQQLTVGVAEQPQSEQAYWALYDRVYGQLRQRYPQAVLAQADAQSAVQTAQNGGGEVPADMTDLAPAVPAASVGDESIPF